MFSKKKLFQIEANSSSVHNTMQVVADVVSFLTEKPDIVTLEICTGLLPVLASLLESDVDR